MTTATSKADAGLARIMVVEDEQAVARVLALTVADLGYEVAGIASSGEEAIAKAREAQPDLILMDIQLAGRIDGIEASALISKECDIPVIYLTAHSDSDTLSRATTTAPLAYLVKPFDHAALRCSIQISLYRREIEANLRERERWLATTLRSIANGVVAIDSDARITFLNPVAEALTGWKQEEAVGKAFEQILTILEPPSAGPSASLHRVLREKEGMPLSAGVLVARAGNTIPIDHSAAPILDDRGDVLGAVMVLRDMTVQRQSDEEIRRLNAALEKDITPESSAAELRALIDYLPELAWTARPDGFIDFCNRRWYEYTGTTLADMQGWRWQSVHDPNELPRVMESWTRSIVSQQPFEESFPLRRNDGAFRWFLTRVAPMFDDAGRLIRWVGINIDIDDQRRDREAARAEKAKHVEQLQALNAALEESVRSRTSDLSQALYEREDLLREATSLLHDRELAILTLRASEADLRLLAESMPQIVWITDVDGKNTYFNERWMSYTGLTFEESLGDGWNDPFHPDDKQRAWDAWKAATASAGIYSLECRLRRADGAYLWWLIRGVPILDASGNVQRWFGTCTDIDAMKRTAEGAQQQTAALVESADDAIITKGLDGTILSWNPGATRLLGYRADESVGRPITMLIPEDRLDEEVRILEQVTTGRRVHHFETLRRRKDGSLVAVSISVSPVRDGSGRIVAAAKIMRDITERKRAEQERKGLVEQLRALNADLEERVRNRTSELSQTLREREALLREKTSLHQEVHHRVKNNLQMISSLLNLQARQILDKDARESFLETQGRVRSIALLHESLYQSDDLGRVDMQEYVDKLVVTLKRVYGESASGTRFVVDIDQVYLPVDVAVPCGLIVNELVTNSLKHAFVHAHHGAREIRIEMRRVDGDLTLTVMDNGSGFESTVDPGHDETMGVTLVRELSLQLRGHAEFATANGARCTVRFPARTATSTSDGPASGLS